MKGDATCSDVLVCSIYDTKPVHIVSTVAENFMWTLTKKKLYNKIEKNTVDMTFHSLNVIHMYNIWMGSVDDEYIMSLQYRPGNSMSYRNWWWSIFLWGLGGAVTNEYLI